MMTRATKIVEANLKGLSYPEIEQALAKVEAQTLIELFDSKSLKIGDTAVSLLSKRKAYPLLISAALEGEITTRVGKIRTKNVLFSTGRKYPDALNVYLLLLKDDSDEIAQNSLLALVYWGDKKVIPSIRERGKRIKSSEDSMEFVRACEALEKSDPASFNPHFTDTYGYWK